MEKDQRRTCANCAKKFALTQENKAYRPFCSKRCKMADLGQWLGEKYVVQGEDATAVPKTDNNE